MKFLPKGYFKEGLMDGDGIYVYKNGDFDIGKYNLFYIKRSIQKW